MRMIVAFEKTEQVRHIGHLDLMRAMQRALRRSGLPIRYSQGFNPHVVLSFASPLSVGMSGEEELMDVALDADVSEADFAQALRGALPPSLPMVSVRAVDDKHPALMAQLRTAEYMGVSDANEDALAMAKAVSPLLERTEIMAMRKTKRGETLCDIRPMIHALSAQADGERVLFRFRTSLMERETLKPSLLLGTLATAAEANIPTVLIKRIRLYGEKDGLPVPLLTL